MNKLTTTKGTIPKILESTVAEINNVYFEKIIEENHKYHVMFYDKITNGDIYFEIDMKDIKNSLLDINNKIKIWKSIK